MAKINVVAALNQAAEEAAWVSSHPYAGLADERGTLERYPIDRILVEDPTLKLCPRAWLEAFLFEGGNVDAMGVYGISPWEREDRTPIWEILPGFVAGRLFSEGEERYRESGFTREARDHYRWDALGSIYSIVKAQKAGLDVQVSSDISLDDFIRLKTGCERYHLLHEAGAKLKPIMTLGHMSPESFNFHLAKTCTRRTWQVAFLATELTVAYTSGMFPGEIRDVENARHQYERFKGTFFGHLILCKIKAQKRFYARHRYLEHLYKNRSAYQFSSKRALLWLVEGHYALEDYIRRKDEPSFVPDKRQKFFIKNKELRVFWGFDKPYVGLEYNSEIDHSHTSVGLIYWTTLSSGELVMWNDMGHQLKVHSVPGTNFLVILARKFYATYIEKFYGAEEARVRTYFIWDREEGFRFHVEGSSLKDASEKLLMRKKRKGLILSLNDVRNDRTGTSAFCLAGVKNFLRRRMPHLARLIEPYSAWEQIPDEVMSIEWTLVSRDIFEGYSEP